MAEYRYYLVTRDALAEYADGRGMTREDSLPKPPSNPPAPHQ